MSTSPLHRWPSYLIGTTLLLAGLVEPAAPARGQAHFTACASHTGHNATVIIPQKAALGIADDALEPGDEIAVFSDAGRCAGAVRWEGQNTALTVWGDDEATRAQDGLLTGDTLHVRVWDASAAAEYGAHNSTIRLRMSTRLPYMRPEPTYVANAIFVVDTLRVAPHVP